MAATRSARPPCTRPRRNRCEEHAMTDKTFQSSFPRYEWPDGKTSAFCFTCDVDAESVYLWQLRNDQPPRALSHMEQRAFGPRTGSWRLLDLLDRYGIKGTFYVPGYVAETYPDLLPAFVGRG